MTYHSRILKTHSQSRSYLKADIDSSPVRSRKALQRMLCIVDAVHESAKKKEAITEAALLSRLRNSGLFTSSGGSDPLRVVRKQVEAARKDYGFPIIAYPGKSNKKGEKLGYTYPRTTRESADYMARLKGEIEMTLTSRSDTYEALRASLGQTDAPSLFDNVD